MEERFLMIVHDLEEKIMKVWNTADDLDAVLHYIENADIEPEYMDDLMNMVIGIQALHERKCKMLFQEFERVLKSNVDSFYGPDEDNTIPDSARPWPLE